MLEVSHTIKIQNLDHLDHQKWSDFISKNLFFFARVNRFLKWYMYYDYIFTPWYFRCTVSHRLPWNNKNAIYHLQISALVPEIFKLEKCSKYVNEITDGIIHSTQYYLKYKNRATSANLQRRPLKLCRLIVLRKHIRSYKRIVSMETDSFPPTWFQYFTDFQLEKR